MTKDWMMQEGETIPPENSYPSGEEFMYDESTNDSRD